MRSSASIWLRSDFRLTPILVFSVVASAQLAVFWLALYRILPFTFLALCVVFWATQIKVFSISDESIALLKSFACVYIYMGLSTFWSPTPSIGMEEFLRTLAVVIPPLCFGILIAQRYDLAQIATGIAIVPLLFLAQALYGWLTNLEPMVVGEFNMRTHLAGLLCLIVPLLGAGLFERRNLLTVASLLASVILVMLTESRSAQLIVIPVLFYVIFTKLGEMARIALISVVLVAAALVALIGVDSPFERFGEEHTSLRLDSKTIDEYVYLARQSVDAERRAHTVITSELFVENPILGGGYSTTLQTFERMFGVPMSAHGLLPGVISELGIVGFLLILHVFWRIRKVLVLSGSQGPKNNNASFHGYHASFMALFAFGLFHQLFEWAYFAMIVGILIGFRQRVKRTRLKALR